MQYQDYMTAAVVILGIMTAYNTVCTAVNNWRSERKRRNDPTARLQETAADHERRIVKLEKQSEKQYTESKLILRGLVALLHHEVDGNNTAGLKESQQEIQDYLIGK